MISRNRLLALAACCLSLTASGQIILDKCGTVTYEKQRSQHNSNLETIDQFEQWMKTKVNQRKRFPVSGRGQTTYVIPVVVHIIYTKADSAAGNGTYISDAQVQSQIDVLNADYPRGNADAINTPLEFQTVAGGIDMQFVLAKQDPEGLPTTGIVRALGSKSSWTMADNATFKSISYWPAENYLNIWVLRLQDPSGLIGYAQLPVSDQLQGLENASTDRLTDGVVVDYRAFGTGFPNLYSQFNKGRTATHEIGHFFGLRHTWGDVQNCNGTDYCDDTPTQLGSTSGCPSQPSLSCGHDKMFQNYMDYTDDACMNLFTVDQIGRMVVVLGGSPRRASLLVSPGATPPVSVPNDLGIKRIASPRSSSCPSVTPSIVVRNYGSNSVTTSDISVSINGSPVETLSPPLNLAPLDSATITFSPISNLLFGSQNKFSFAIQSTNGTTDGKASNDTLSVSTAIPSLVNLPLYEQFNSVPATWTISNADGQTTWQNVTAPNATSDNKAMFINFYDYESQGEIDKLIMPVFDLSTDTAAILKFDRAYATISSQYHDQLRVIVSTDCDFSHAIEIFNKSGTALATAPNTSNPFVPSNESEWATEVISLTQFLGQANVQIAFVGINDYGNNLYIDNVRVISGNYTDLVLKELKSPSPVSCVADPTPVVTIQNNGSTVITDFTINTQVNGGSPVALNVSGLHLDTGEETDVTLSPWSLNPGANTVNINVVNANEVNPSDNALGLNQVISDATDIVPLRENFDSSYPDWTIVSETQQLAWTATQTNKRTSLVYDAYDNVSIGNKSWLVSPTLDLSKTQKASLFFDVSYAKATTGNERLRVLLSTDCGLTFPIVALDKTGDKLSDIQMSGTAWAPTQDSDWKRLYISLDTVTLQSNVRIAWVITNGNGNNLYIDNIEIYVDDDPTPVTVTSLFSVYNVLKNGATYEFQDHFGISFNLPDRQDVRMRVFNSIGQVVIDNMLPDTLNQTYDVDMSGQQGGIYIVHVQMGSDQGAAKVFIPH